MPGDGALANLPVVGIDAIGWAFVTITSLLDLRDALLLRWSPIGPDDVEGVTCDVSTLGEGACCGTVDELEAAGVVEGAGLGSTC